MLNKVKLRARNFTFMSTLGDRIRELRGVHSQKWLAEQLGIPPTTLSNYENNKSELNFAIILALKTIFKVDTDWLLFGNTEASLIPDNPSEAAMAEPVSGCSQCRELLRQLGVANERVYQTHEREMALLKENNELEKAKDLEEKYTLLHAEIENLKSKRSLSSTADDENPYQQTA